MFARLFFGLALVMSTSQSFASALPMEPQQACRGMYSDRAEVSCLAAIRDVAELLDRNAVSVCYRNTPDSTAVACLRQMARTPEATYHLGALNVCDSMIGSGSVNRCMGIVRGAASFSDNAVSVCAKRQTNVAKNRCLRTIAGFAYTDEDAETCERLYVDAQAIRCLRLAGTLAQ